VSANGLAHHVLEWSGPEARTVVVLHGYLDHARSFVRVGDALARAGHRVLALDFRGHGDSARVPAGGYYHFPDYVADVAGVLDALAPVARVPTVAVVGHSMGGTVATMFAGAFPARVRALAVIEGLGPPAMGPEVVPDRVRTWLETVARVRAAGESRRIASREEAVARLRTSHGDRVSDAVLAEVAAHATRPHPSGEGLVWHFDPLHQTRSPTRFER
jgi:pimeloyl-ACP methyl ester carboxylesterase